MAKRLKRVNELFKHEIVVAAEVLFEQNLKLSDNKPVLLGQLTALMTDNTQCPGCEGPCDVLNHVFNVGVPPYVDENEVSIVSEASSSPTSSLATTTTAPSTPVFSSALGSIAPSHVNGIHPLDGFSTPQPYGTPQPGMSGVGCQGSVVNDPAADIRLLQSQMAQLLSSLSQPGATVTSNHSYPQSMSTLPPLPTVPSLAPPLQGQSGYRAQGFPFSVAPHTSTLFTSQTYRPAFTSTSGSSSGRPPPVQNNLTNLQQNRPPHQQSQLSQYDLLKRQFQQNQQEWQERMQQQQQEHQRQQDLLLHCLESVAHPQHASLGHGRPPAYPPLLQGSSSTFKLPAGSLSSHNEVLSNLCGVSVGPLQSFDLNDQYQLNGTRHKIVSGLHAAAWLEVHQQILWPHHALDFVSVPVPPDFRDLMPNPFAAGEAAIVLSQLPPSL